jgi:hypothetical protein
LPLIILSHGKSFDPKAIPAMRVQQAGNSRPALSHDSGNAGQRNLQLFGIGYNRQE